MPLFYQQDINETTRLGVWQITEDESFFMEKVPLNREISHPHKRLQHLAGRYLLQVLFPDFPYELIRIADTRKPYLQDEAYHFSISHCGNTAAALVSSTFRVGVDVEDATPRIGRILKKFLHPEELDWLNSQTLLKEKDHQDNDTVSAYLLPTLLWSAKESVFKWYGEGQVDFSEHIRLNPFYFGMEGVIPGFFCKNEPFPFSLEYKIMENLCLSWVMGNYTG